MRTFILALGATTIALSSPILAQGRGHGQGHGQGRGNDHAQSGGQRGQGGGQREARGNRGGGQNVQRDDHGGGRGRGRGADDQARPEHANRGAQQAQRQREARGRGADDRGFDDRGRGRGADDRRFDDRGRGHASRGEDRRERRAERGRDRVERRAVVVTDRSRIVHLRRDPQRIFVRGCPPGLARRNNGCLPPGQARQLLAERPWYGNWWNYPDGRDYRYDGGYLYRLQPDGIVAGFIPLAGGALWPGNPWPGDFAYEPLPDYYADYYGYDEPYDYRYADGIVYGLDPETSMIREIAGLLTGDDWSIGSRMPAGYDVYNVPYDYRDEYSDTDEDWYRYSDGYVYRVDPTTQLIEAAIQLIA